MSTPIPPGWEGAVGPFKGQYGQPHVYARDVQSGVGNCVCGHHDEHPRHLFRPPAHGRTVRTYYRATLADGTLWCESRDRDEVVNSGRDHEGNPIKECEGMTFAESCVLEVHSPWQRITP